MTFKEPHKIKCAFCNTSFNENSIENYYNNDWNYRRCPKCHMFVEGVINDGEKE